MILMEEIFKKFVPNKHIKIELMKTKQATHIAEETGLFYVPKVLSFDVEKGLLEIEHLKRLRTLEELAICNDDRLPNLIEKLGRALVAIHNNLTLPSELKINLPDEWMSPNGDNVFIHGDLTMCNVCIHEPTERLVIVDWSSAPIFDMVATFGTRYFDIIWFISHIFYKMPIKCVFKWKANRLTDKFMNGYTTGKNSNLDFNMFCNFQNQMQSLYQKFMRRSIEKRPWNKRIFVFPFQMYIYGRWKKYKPRILTTNRN